MLGNEGAGLNQKQIEICHQFVYIPQYTDKTASLNVAIAGSIIFHHFALWAGYQEHSREGYKYETVGENAIDYKNQENRSVVTYVDYENENGQISTNDTEKIREQRALKKDNAECKDFSTGLMDQEQEDY